MRDVFEEMKKAFSDFQGPVNKLTNPAIDAVQQLHRMSEQYNALMRNPITEFIEMGRRFDALTDPLKDLRTSASALTQVLFEQQNGLGKQLEAIARDLRPPISEFPMPERIQPFELPELPPPKIVKQKRKIGFMSEDF